MKIKILDVNFDNITMTIALKKIENFIQSDNKYEIVTLNPEFLMKARKDAEFKEILNKADLAVPDGVGLVWAARLLGYSVVERVGGADLMEQLVSLAEKKGWTVFFLGAADGVAEEVARVLANRYQKLKIVGTYSGDPSSSADEETVRRINKSNRKINLLFVAYGAPRQEKWIFRNLSKVDANVAIGVGGTFDYISMRKRRAPRLLQNLGLEWLFRLIQEPWRWKRQLWIPFMFLILLERLKKKTP